MHVRRSLLSLAVAATLGVAGCSAGETSLTSVAHTRSEHAQKLWDYDHWFETARLQARRDTAQASSHEWVRALPWLGVMPVLTAPHSG